MPSDFLADRGDGSMKASGDGAQCVTGDNTSGNLFTLAKAQYSRCTTALRGRNTPLRLAGRGTGSWSAGLARWRCRDAHPAVLRLPVEVGRTADPMLPGQLAECDSGFAFLQDRNDL